MAVFFCHGMCVYSTYTIYGIYMSTVIMYTGVFSVVKRCRCNLCSGSNLSHRDFMFTEGPCGHSTNICSRHEKKKRRKKKKQLYEMTDRMCGNGGCET